MMGKIPAAVKDCGKIFIKAGYQCFLVGGAIRDRMMGLETSDFDLATDAQPNEVQRLFRRVIPTGIQHGTVTVLFKGHSFEVTTFRIEGRYSNQRHPDSIEFTPDVREDLKRRDFTVNAMALDLASGELLDPHRGRDDIKNHLIRAIGSPRERFNEDGLRLLRAVRFMSQLEFSIAPPTLEGMAISAANIKRISPERIKDELIKILLSRKPSRAFLTMEETGILKHILPELSACRGITQKGRHKFDVFDHSIYSADGAAKHILEIPLAALLHDLGKAAVADFDAMGIPTFYSHEVESVKMGHRILRRLKFPRSVEQKVCHLIEHHMFNYTEDWSDGAVRRFLKRVNPDNLEDLFHLRRADDYGRGGFLPPPHALRDFQRRIDGIMAQDAALSVKDLKLNGHELHREAGIPKGPHMGNVLEFLLEAVIDDPALNERERLLEMAGKFYRKKMGIEKA